MDLATELSEAADRVRADGELAERLAAVLAALVLARRVIAILEEDGDPVRFASYATAAIEIIEAGHAVRRAPALGRTPEVEVSSCRSGPRSRSTDEGAEVRALIELADVLDVEFTAVTEAAVTVNDRLACLAVARHAVRWRDALAPGGPDGDLR